MSEDKPHDAVLQQQLEYLSDQARKATNSKTIIIISINGDESENIQVSIQMPKPERREDRVAMKGRASLAMITVAATLLEKDTRGKFQLMIKKPSGDLVAALTDDMGLLIVEKGFV